MLRVVAPALVLLFCFVGPAGAADETPSVGDTSSSLPEEPDVTIIHRGQERVEEYRMNDRVYMVKITPAKGYPYYLIDTTGDGNFDTRRTGLGQEVVVPQWVLFRWK